MPDPMTQFASAKYINLETFRKSGIGVRTPVWFAQAGNRLYVYSESDAGKVKRIRNNPKVRIAPCNFRGSLRGSWAEGQALLCEGEQAERAQKLLRSKYGLLKIIGDFVSLRVMGHSQILIAIQIEASAA